MQRKEYITRCAMSKQRFVQESIISANKNNLTYIVPIINFENKNCLSR